MGGSLVRRCGHDRYRDEPGRPAFLRRISYRCAKATLHVRFERVWNVSATVLDHDRNVALMRRTLEGFGGTERDTEVRGRSAWEADTRPTELLPLGRPPS